MIADLLPERLYSAEKQEQIQINSNQIWVLRFNLNELYIPDLTWLY